MNQDLCIFYPSTDKNKFQNNLTFLSFSKRKQHEGNEGGSQDRGVTKRMD